MADENRYVVLLGKVGHGKTRLLNELTGSTYRSSAGNLSCTRRLQKGQIAGSEVFVLDTPGLYSSDDVAGHINAQVKAFEHPISGIYVVVRFGEPGEMAEVANRVMDMTSEEDVRVICTHLDTEEGKRGFDGDRVAVDLSYLLEIPKEHIAMVGKNTDSVAIEKFILNTIHRPRDIKVAKEQRSVVASLSVGSRKFNVDIDGTAGILDEASQAMAVIDTLSDGKFKTFFTDFMIQKSEDVLETACNDIKARARDLLPGDEAVVCTKLDKVKESCLKSFKEKHQSSRSQEECMNCGGGGYGKSRKRRGRRTINSSNSGWFSNTIHDVDSTFQNQADKEFKAALYSFLLFYSKDRSKGNEEECPSTTASAKNESRLAPSARSFSENPRGRSATDESKLIDSAAAARNGSSATNVGEAELKSSISTDDLNKGSAQVRKTSKDGFGAEKEHASKTSLYQFIGSTASHENKYYRPGTNQNSEVRAKEDRHPKNQFHRPSDHPHSARPSNKEAKSPSNPPETEVPTTREKSEVPVHRSPRGRKDQHSVSSGRPDPFSGGERPDQNGLSADRPISLQDAPFTKGKQDTSNTNLTGRGSCSMSSGADGDFNGVAAQRISEPQTDHYRYSSGGPEAVSCQPCPGLRHADVESCCPPNNARHEAASQPTERGDEEVARGYPSIGFSYGSRHMLCHSLVGPRCNQPQDWKGTLLGSQMLWALATSQRPPPHAGYHRRGPEEKQEEEKPTQPTACEFYEDGVEAYLAHEDDCGQGHGKPPVLLHTSEQQDVEMEILD
ncbi:expressed unknown protein [Seminavis robusta]|uniref:G domain-containing protein n=1 Tax=Seminavis robusta TaxID=568900 RepID=A0A9N8HJN1_9STRA|nr:expressed unknown protein [Seminavis robusta]|eukprot:Sro562_g166940.1 n/a (785) ;mRNA; f:7624-9978